MRASARLALLLLAVAGAAAGFVSGASASEEETWSGAAVEGWKAHEAGSYDAAIDRYREAIDGGDFRPELPFNLGNALFRKALAAPSTPDSTAGVAVPPPSPGAPAPPPAGPDPTLIDAALESFDRAAGTGDDALRARSLTNAGTLRATRGEVEEAKELFKEALRLDPTDMRARYNLEFLLTRPPAPSDSSGDGQDEGEPQETSDEGEPEPQENNDPSDPGSEEPEPNENANPDPDSENPPPPDPSDPPEEEEPQPEPTPSEEASEEEAALSPEEARRELDRLEELERELLKKLLYAKRRRANVEKDW